MIKISIEFNVQIRLRCYWVHSASLTPPPTHTLTLVPGLTNQWSSMCVYGIDLASVSTMFRLTFRIWTVCYFCCLFLLSF